MGKIVLMSLTLSLLFFFPISEMCDLTDKTKQRTEIFAKEINKPRPVEMNPVK